jgi:hypothetical protein
MSSLPNIFIGSAVWIQGENNHPAFILSDPEETGGAALFIRFTSFVPEKHQGVEVFNNQDCPDLRHESVVAYYGAKAPEASMIQGAINDGTFKVISPLKFPAIKRIVDEARIHDDFPPKFVKFLPSEGHPDCQG